MKSGNEIGQLYHAQLETVTTDIRDAFNDVVNLHAPISVLEQAVEKYRTLRGTINAKENAFVALGIGNFVITFAPLTGDPKKDVGQGKPTLH